jgi:hypothetical protein
MIERTYCRFLRGSKIKFPILSSLNINGNFEFFFLETCLHYQQVAILLTFIIFNELCEFIMGLNIRTQHCQHDTVSQLWSVSLDAVHLVESTESDFKLKGGECKWSQAQIPSSTPYSQTPSVYVPPSMSVTKFHTHINNGQNYSSIYLDL